MSFHPDSAITRRRFLQIVLSTTGAFVAVKLTPAFAEENPKAAHWALFSDLHIKPQDEHAHPPKGLFYCNQHAHLTRCVQEALAAKPDGLIITGDLARLTGDLNNYQKLAEFLAPMKDQFPIFSAMGNHDDRDHFAQVFSDLPARQPVPHKLVQVIEKGPVRFILLDSMMAVNKGTGQLGAEQLDWLRGYLAKCDDRPTLLFFHHNPGQDVNGFEDWESLVEIIRPSLKVKACIFGHSHVYAYKEQDGIHLVNLPAMGYSFSAKDPVGWVDARFTAEGGIFTLHAVEGPMEEDNKPHRLKWRTAVQQGDKPRQVDAPRPKKKKKKAVGSPA